MNLSLTPEQEAFVAEAMASGQYESVEELIDAALRFLADQERLRKQHQAEFQQELQRRLDSLDRGEGIPGAEVEAHFREKAARRRQQAARSLIGSPRKPGPIWMQSKSTSQRTA